MGKIFNINGVCRPEKHYMVELGPRLAEIKAMVDDGAYFTMNRARQYGKTTTLRAAYQENEVPAFHSVILAGVYDIRNIKRKLRDDGEHMENSPWNIAADFLVDMSFTRTDIAGMLRAYEDDCRTGMEIQEMAELLYDYTSGYPYLVSRLCKLMDERIAGSKEFPDKGSAWTKEGFLAALKMLLEEGNPLFDSLANKLNRYPELDGIISRLLFQGQSIAYNADDAAVRNAQMFGFVKICNATVQIANRIFESRLYNRYLLDYTKQNSQIYEEASRQKKIEEEGKCEAFLSCLPTTCP